MKVVQHAPAARGVNQLMYVGDVDTTGGPPRIPPLVLVLAALAGWLLLRGR